MNSITVGTKPAPRIERAVWMIWPTRGKTKSWAEKLSGLCTNLRAIFVMMAKVPSEPTSKPVRSLDWPGENKPVRTS